MPFPPLRKTSRVGGSGGGVPGCTQPNRNAVVAAEQFRTTSYRRCDHGQVRVAGEQRLQCDVSFDAGKACAEAVVDSCGEREMVARVGAGDVESVGFLEHGWAAVG